MKLACFPCEIQHREFDSKLLLAAHLTARSKDYISLVGFDRYFSNVLDKASACFLFDKSMSTLMLNARIKPCKDKDGIVFINDEEGVNDLDETPEALDIRADDNAGLIIDQYLAWGRDDARFFGLRKPSISSKITITGSHRYDLLTNYGKQLYKNDINSLKTIFGNYILYNDNLAVDHFDKNYVPPTNQFDAHNSAHYRANQEWDSIVDEHRQRRQKVKTFILDLAGSGYNVIVRPHPVYDSIFWHDSFRLHPRITTLYRGNVEPWIHASMAVVTTGCTTGLQALYANKPSFELPICDSSRAFSSKILPRCTSFKLLLPSSIAALDDTFNIARSKCQQRWHTSDSTTSDMSELISISMDTLPHQNSLDWINQITPLTPMAPKWRNITTPEVVKRFTKIKQIIGAPDQLNISKVANSLYIIHHA